VFQVATGIPQLVKTVRSANVSGLSPSSISLSVAASWAWAIYSFVRGLPESGVASTLAAVVVTATAVAMARTRGWTLLGTAVGLAWGGLLAMTGLLIGAAGVGLLLSVQVLGQHTPQIWATLYHHNLSGLSAATWWLRGANGLIWLSYAALQRDRYLLLWGTVTLCASIIVLVQIRRKAPSMFDESGVQGIGVVADD
jgi:uncharacterized protein with PQ loop repeat